MWISSEVKIKIRLIIFFVAKDGEGLYSQQKQDREPDEPWTEVCDTVQETGIKTIPMEKKCKKVVWGGLTNSCKRREAKSKGEKERYFPLNAEFQRIARRDKKDFLSNHCKEIEENNRMGKTRDLFKKIIVTKGTFHAKVCSITDRNSFNGRRK